MNSTKKELLYVCCCMHDESQFIQALGRKFNITLVEDGHVIRVREKDCIIPEPTDIKESAMNRALEILKSGKKFDLIISGMNFHLGALYSKEAGMESRRNAGIALANYIRRISPQTKMVFLDEFMPAQVSIGDNRFVPGISKNLVRPGEILSVLENISFSLNPSGTRPAEFNL